MGLRLFNINGSVGTIKAYYNLDVDAYNFLVATNLINDSTYVTSINQLVSELKYYNIWNKLAYAYPYIGSTSTTQKFNLKDPRDLNAAYRISFAGGWVHTVSGATPNGVNGYGNTYFSPNAFASTNASFGVMGYTAGFRDNDIPMGTRGDGSNRSQFFLGDTCCPEGDFVSLNMAGENSAPTLTYDRIGFFTMSRNNTSNIDYYKNKSRVTVGGGATSPTSLSYYVGARQTTPGRGDFFFSNMQQIFAFAGQYINSTEMNNFYEILIRFQRNINRGPVLVSDSDAQNFINEGFIVDTTQGNAINTLVESLKSNNLWTELDVIYPMVGGTGTAATLNLKNPSSLTTSFRLRTPFQYARYSITNEGIKGDGANNLTFTEWIPNTNFSSTGGTGTLGIYSTTRVSGNLIDYGAQNTVSDSVKLLMRDSSGNTVASFATGVDNSVAVDDSRGLYTLTRTGTGATDMRLYINSDLVLSGTSAYTGSFSTSNLSLGNMNAAGVFSGYSSRNYAFGFLSSKGLNSTQVTNLYNIIAQFQSTLIRGPKLVSDVDAQRFINKVFLTNQTQCDAINNFVTRLKTANLWTNLKAIYPFVGDTDYSNQFNLKNSVNTDSSFRLSFSGDWVYTTVGIKPNGANTFANTFLTPSTAITSTTYFGMYMRTPQLTATTSIDGGVISGSSLWISPYYTGNTNQGINTSVELTSPSTGQTYGYFHINKTGTTSQLYYDGTLLTSTTDSGILPTSNIYLGAVNSGGTATQFSSREIALTIIGEGLSDDKVIELNDIVQLFIQECGKTPVLVSDPDAQNFINQASISNTTQGNAINTLVIGLKNESLWNKMKILYPFVGGTANSHKYNLRDPQDTNGAFRLSFFGGWSHDNNGAKANGVNSYANTYLQPSTQLTTSNYSYGGYSRNNENGLGYNGCGTPNWFIQSFHSYNLTQFYSTNGTRIESSGTFGFLNNVKNGNDKYIYRNGSVLVSGSTVETSLPNNTFYVGAVNNGTPVFYDNKQLAFYYISETLNSSEVLSFYNLVQQFQTTLNRQV
jgi:hypothetical protein